MLKLFIGPGSSSMAPHIALVEAGAEFELVPLSMGKRETRSAEYRKVNPAGKVPTLMLDDGEPLTEVLAILWYVAKRYPDAKLLPDGGLEAEALALSWMSYIASGIHPTTLLDKESRYASFVIGEQKLGMRTWAMGDRMSIVDIHLFRLFWRNHERTDLTREAFPGLWAHYERMMERPAVKTVIEVESAIGYELPK